MKMVKFTKDVQRLLPHVCKVGLSNCFRYLSLRSYTWDVICHLFTMLLILWSIPITMVCMGVDRAGSQPSCAAVMGECS